MNIRKTFLLALCLPMVHASPALGIDRSLLELPIEVHDGAAVRLQDLVGKKPIYLKFWASWCVPCRQQMPHLEGIYEKYSDELEIVSVNIWINETEEALVATREEFGLTVPIAIDAGGELAQAFDFIGTPYHVLIDLDGDVVHTGHQADADLDGKIESLASRETSGLSKLAVTPSGTTPSVAAHEAEGLSVLFFTATWCDWYLEESRPEMSAACIRAQRNMNRVHEMIPDLNIVGLATRLWTGEKELEEYVDKYDIRHSIAVDETNDAFFALNVKTVPTLIVLQDGEELYRTSKLDSVEDIAAAIRQFAP